MPNESSPTSAHGHARLVDWAGLQLHLVWCYAGPVSHYGRHGATGSEEMTAWLVRKGSVTILSQEGASITARVGEWLVTQKGLVKRDFSDDADIVSIRFQACWSDKQNVFEGGLPLRMESSRYPEMEQCATVLAAFVKEHFRNPKVSLPLAKTTLSTYIDLQSLFLGWLYAFIAALTAEGLVHTRFGKTDERVRQGLFLIDLLPLDRPFPKEVIAKELSLSVCQFDRIFVKEIGLTPLAYFETRRLNFARNALAEPGAIVKAVAYGLGFQSASHFSTWFLRMHGQSPRVFIRLAQRENVAFRPSDIARK